jgi:hypothetical protein
MKNCKFKLGASMMSKNILASLMLSLSMYQSVAAQEVITVDIPAMCVGIAPLSEMLGEFGETPAMVMTSKREIQGTAMSNNIVLFVNFKEKTYTLVERVAKDTYCILAIGDSIRPYSK